MTLFLPPVHLSQHLLCRHRRKSRHNLQILLLAHLLIAPAHLRQDLEVINIERRRERVEELRFLVRGVGECVRCANGDCDVVANVSIVVGVIGRMETDNALCDEESLIMHLMPVCGWTSGLRGKGEFGGADAVIYVVLLGRGDTFQYKGSWCTCS
jgi:hypothetical protein